MSERLSDQIITLGPFVVGQVIPFDLSVVRMNELREELICQRGSSGVTTPREWEMIQTLEAVIRRTVPEQPGPGYFLAVYLAGPPEWGGPARWAVCPHGHVCLSMARGWRHPEPHRPAWCDKEPVTSFSVML